MTTTRIIRGYCTPQIVIKLHIWLVDPTSLFFKTCSRGANSNPSNSHHYEKNSFRKVESLSKPLLPTATLNASEIRQTHQLRDRYFTPCTYNLFSIPGGDRRISSTAPRKILCNTVFPPGWQVGLPPPFPLNGTFRISKVSRPSWHQGLWNKDGGPAVLAS